MKYSVRHATRYNYRSVVPLARHILRLTPVGSSRQQVMASSLSIDPVPAEQHVVIDPFGNHTLEITIDSDHRFLDIRGADEVVVLPTTGAEAVMSQTWERVAADAMETFDIRAASPAHFIFGSRVAKPLPQITAYARSSFPAGNNILAGAIDLKRRIAHDFIYDPDATTVVTPVADAFVGGRGVCQDFAHIMIAALRGLGIPAAYVSGYLATTPPPGQARLVGADAMHAWVRVWCGYDAGWVDLDPTNAVVVDRGHVTLALGRDYADVAPVGGVLITSGGQSLSSWVDVVAVDDR